MPNAVFSGTAMSAISSVSLSAFSASGDVIASQTGASPPENVCHTMMLTGTRRSAAR